MNRMERGGNIMNKEYIDVTSYEGEGYLPLVDYKSWRVAILNYCDELLTENIETMQKHDETDEVFVLLRGNCKLYVGGNEGEVGELDSIQMEPLKLYNVKRGVWHTHTLDKEGMVLIVENQDTNDFNSPTQKLSEEQRIKLQRL